MSRVISVIGENAIWNNLSRLISELDSCEIASKHLERCQRKIRGYWDSKNNFYEEIYFINFPAIELVSSAIGINKVEGQDFRWIKLKFLLKIDSVSDMVVIEDEEIGELTLILDADLKVIDENWSVDVDSPFVVATPTRNLS